MTILSNIWISKRDQGGGRLRTTILSSSGRRCRDRALEVAEVSYADLEYDKFTGGQCYPGRTPDSPTNPTACDLSGERPINAPKWKTNLALTYETPVSWGDVYARADWAWSDDYNTSFSADPLLVQSSYSWVSARIGTHWNNLEFVVWGDNLTDEDVSNVEATANIYSGDKSFQSFLQPPRSYGLTVRANY